MKHHNGFTLIEMLVSMALLSMIMLLSSSAYSQFTQRWSGKLGKFNEQVEFSKKMLMVQSSLKSLTPYVVLDDNELPTYYFEGNRNGFVGVTQRSIFTPELAAIVRFQLTQNSDLTYRLEYQESPMDAWLLTSFDQDIEFVNGFVLFDSITEANFSYFGWLSKADRDWTPDSRNFRAPKPEWIENYNSVERRMLPKEIKLVFSSGELSYDLSTVLSEPVPSTLANYAN